MLIQTLTMGSPTGTVVFSNIPQTYNNLLVSGNLRSSVVAVKDDLQLSFNWTPVISVWGTLDMNNTTGPTMAQASTFSSSLLRVGLVAGSTLDANYAATCLIDIPCYRANITQNTESGRGVIGNSVINSATVGNNYRRIAVGNMTASSGSTAVTSLTFTLSSGANFTTGSIFVLQGY